jgi:hypothetical protein
MLATNQGLRVNDEYGPQPSCNFLTNIGAIPVRLKAIIGNWLIVTFAILVLASTPTQAQTSNDATLYFFTNDGCAPCLMVEPVIEALHNGGYPVKTIKVADYPQFASQVGVDRTPSVLMIKSNRITHRRAGLVDGPTLQQWFAQVGIARPPAFDRLATPQNQALRPRKAVQQPQRPNERVQRVGTKVVVDRSVKSVDGRQPISRSFSSPTMHQGTARPRTTAEQRALLATVKLSVEDPDGTSYASGTVIHTHGTESLVMTCGHVFRDSQGKGKISAEYDFYGDRQTAPGRLVDYDSDARDVALVVIKTDRPIPAVPLAEEFSVVRAGQDVFSIGCDHGEDPTIRHTRIKNRAAYDGALKYDIFGRPVDGRSGGGLFTDDGKLVGVCNSAAVEVDEGIYTALDTLHWQVAATGLSHLFESQKSQVASNNSTPPQRRFAEVGPGKLQFAAEIGNARRRDANALVSQEAQRSSMAPIYQRDDLRKRNDAGLNLAPKHPAQSNYEVVIHVRSKQDPRRSEKIIIDDPTPELIKYLGRMSD